MRAAQKLQYRARHHFNKFLMRILGQVVPELLEGTESIPVLAQRIKESGISKILIVTGKNVEKNPLFNDILQALDENSIQHVTYDGAESNPTQPNVEAGVSQYLAGQCEGILAVGGGSKIDCAKAIGARVSNPQKSVGDLTGILKVKNKPPPLFVVPTTTGSGSETTGFSLITDPGTSQKGIIIDPKLVPRVSLLIPEFITSLPAKHTAWTGIDALTHAVESYLSVMATKQSKDWSLNATRILLANLEAACVDGSSVESRKQCQQGSYYAGLGLARAGTGYVHALSHNIGAYYNIDHGLANAYVLPSILEMNCPECNNGLASLAIACGLGTAGEGNDVLAGKFVARVKDLMATLAIPRTMKELRAEDIPMLVDRAYVEAHPTSAVPKFMEKEDLTRVLESLVDGK